MHDKLLRRNLVAVVAIMLLFSLGRIAWAETPGVEPTAEVTPPGEATAAPGEEAPPPTPTSVLDVIPTRTPAPTATPGVIAQQVTRLTARAGLATAEFLGLSITDWVNLGISILWVLIGYLLGTWLIKGILPRVVRGTATELDDRLLAAVGKSIRWLVVLIVLQPATARLTFLSAGLKTILGDVYFVLMAVLGFRIIWQVLEMAAQWYRDRAAQENREEQLSPMITLLVRLSQAILIVIAISILLSHFGINVTAFAAVLGIGGLALSLAAKDVIADTIDGFIILVDQPFRIGDRIEIQGVGTWGDVTDIGLRTTRIRTRDNRVVIVPNSVIGSNQVINYSYPDPRYRIETHVGIGYGQDIEKVRRIIIETVRQVEGVLPDKPVDALYNEMGDSAMIFRVRWWIESYSDTRRMFDQVHTALQKALDEAGIEMPFPTQNVNVQMAHGTDEQAAPTMEP